MSEPSPLPLANIWKLDDICGYLLGLVWILNPRGAPNPNAPKGFRREHSLIVYISDLLTVTQLHKLAILAYHFPRKQSKNMLEVMVAVRFCTPGMCKTIRCQTSTVSPWLQSLFRSDNVLTDIYTTTHVWVYLTVKRCIQQMHMLFHTIWKDHRQRVYYSLHFRAKSVSEHMWTLILCWSISAGYQIHQIR